MRVEIVDLDDVGMTQSGDRFCLPLESREQFRLGFDVAVHEFDRYVPVEGEVRAEKDLRHAPAREVGFDAYLSDGLSDPVCHAEIIQPKAERGGGETELIWLLAHVCVAPAGWTFSD